MTKGREPSVRGVEVMFTDELDIYPGIPRRMMFSTVIG